MTNKSTGDAGGIEPRQAPGKGKKARLKGLASLDKRTTAFKRATALVEALQNDLGGDRLSAAERELVQRAALASAILQDMEASWLAGRPIDVAGYTTLSNSQSRILKMLGLERRPQDITPDLHRYLEAKATPSPDAAVAPGAPARVILPPPPFTPLVDAGEGDQ